MAKRPSYVSIRARQRNIIEGIGTKRIKYDQAAKELGVTQSELRKFIETKPKKLRKSYNRSPSVRKLFEEGKRSEVREALNVKRIYRYRPVERRMQETVSIRRPNAEQIGHLVELLYKENHTDSQGWTSYSLNHNLPSSIKAIRVLYRNNRISDSEYAAALKAWRSYYPKITDSYYASFADELSDFEQEYEEAS